MIQVPGTKVLPNKQEIRFSSGGAIKLDPVIVTLPILIKKKKIRKLNENKIIHLQSLVHDRY